MAIRADQHTRALIDSLTRDVVAARCALIAETSGSIQRDQLRAIAHYDAVRAPYGLEPIDPEQFGLTLSEID